MQIKEVLNRDFLRRYSFAAGAVVLVAAMTGIILLKDLVGLALGGGGAGNTGVQAKAAPAAPKAKGAAPQANAGGGAPLVEAGTIAEAQFFDAVQALGTAQARESIVITPKVSDTIRALRFDSGDRVRRGQILVELTRVEQAADLAEVRAANAAAQEEMRRYQELFDRGFASQARLDAVRASADAARARLDAGGSRMADRTITAPFAGVMGLRTASPGQLVRPGDQLGTLDDISEIKLDFDVPEARLAVLRTGVPILAQTAAFPDARFEGRIAQVDSRVNPETRTVRVRAVLPNRDERLRPGMLMTVEVRSNPRDALAVPEIAILDRADGAYVYRVAAREGAQTAELTRINAGQRSAGMVEVIDGLQSGDVVITEGLQRVRPGGPVRAEGGGLRGRGAEAPATGASQPPAPRG